MPGLGETIAHLTGAKRAASGVSGPAQMTEVAAFGDNPGALRMLSYIPQGLGRGAPLVVVLHGCTQRAEAYARGAGWLALADRLGFAVVAPEQTSGNNPQRCFNWFQPGDAVRGAGEAASIRAMVAYQLRHAGLDGTRVFVTGLSAGGAMTSVLLAAYPDVFAAGAVVAGLPHGVAEDVGSALRVMKGASGLASTALGDLVRGAAPSGGRIPRLSVWHGATDRTVSPANADELARQWGSAHGLAEAPDFVEALAGRSRAVWGRGGEALVELNLVPGLGHGVPLSTGGADGLGATAPFLLEAGVSSSLEITRFWGLAPAAPAAGVPAPGPVKASLEPPAESEVGAQVMAALAGHTPAGVQEVVAKALRSAGLLR